MTLDLFSWNKVIGYEGNDEISVPLVYFEQTIILNLLIMLHNNPQYFLNDLDSIDLEDFSAKINSLIERMSDA